MLTEPTGSVRLGEHLGHLYRTLNSGLTWSRIRLSNVLYLTVHYPSSTLYVITSPKKNTSNLWTSLDHGQSFRLRATTPSPLRKVFPFPTRPSTLFGFGFDQNDLAISKDAGRSWTPLNNFPFHIGDRIQSDCKATSIQFDNLLFNSANNIFLSGRIPMTRECNVQDCDRDCGDAGLLLISKDNAKTWKKVRFNRGSYALYQEPFYRDSVYASGPKGFYRITPDSVILLSTSYFRDVAISPDDPNRLIGVASLELRQSSDGGLNWRTFAPAFQENTTMVKTADDFRKGFFVCVRSAGILYRNDTHSWIPRNEGITESSVFTVAASSSQPATLYAVTSGNSGFAAFIFRSRDMGYSWENISLNMPDSPDAYEFFRLAVDPGDADHVIAEYRSVYETRDGGRNWKKLLPSGIRDAVFDPFDPRIVYFSRGSYIYRSTEGGPNPRQFSNRIPGGYYRMVPDPNVPQRLYFRGFGSHIYKSDDGGRTVRKIHRILDLYDLKVLGPESTLVAVSYEKGTVRSTDQGKHWQVVSKHFADTIVGIDGTADHLLSTAGNFYGSFVIHESFDGGKHWKDISRQFPPSLSSAKYVPAYNAFDSIFTPIIVATGRGLFIRR